MPRPDLHPVAATIERRAPRPAAATPLGPPKVRRGKRRRLLSAALWTVIATCALAYATSLAVPLWYQLHDQKLLIVTSGSMVPTFDPGDAVVTRNVGDSYELLKPGLMVSFWPLGSTQLVTHRIVSVTNIASTTGEVDDEGRAIKSMRDGKPVEVPYIITKGDANEENDANATPAANVQGIVLSVHPHWGWVLQWAESPAGRAAMLVPPLVALATLEVLAVADGRRRGPRPERRPEERHIDAVLHG